MRIARSHRLVSFDRVRVPLGRWQTSVASKVCRPVLLPLLTCSRLTINNPVETAFSKAGPAEAAVKRKDHKDDDDLRRSLKRQISSGKVKSSGKEKSSGKWKSSGKENVEIIDLTGGVSRRHHRVRPVSTWI